METVKNLEKIAFVWSDLENAYKCYHKNHENVSRVNYLKKLLAWDESGANITGVRNLVKDEMNEYTADEADDYASLFDEMTYVANALKNYKGEIENLNDFLFKSIKKEFMETSDAAERTMSFNMEDLSILRGRTIASTRDNIQDGVLSNLVLKKKDQIVTYEFASDDQFYRCFYDKEDAVRFILTYAKSTVKSEFLNKLLKILISRYNENEQLASIVYLSPELYSIKGRTVTIGPYKVTFNSKNKVSKTINYKQNQGIKEINVEYIMLEVNTIYGKETVILV